MLMQFFVHFVPRSQVHLFRSGSVRVLEFLLPLHLVRSEHFFCFFAACVQICSSSTSIVSAYFGSIATASHWSCVVAEDRIHEGR